MNMKWKVYYDTYKRLAQKPAWIVCSLVFIVLLFPAPKPTFSPYTFLCHLGWLRDLLHSYRVSWGHGKVARFRSSKYGRFFSVDASKPSSLEKLANLWWSINPMRSGRSTLAACLSAAALNKWLVEAVQWTAGQLVLPLPGRYSSLWLF